ncbi:hypothetical protein MNBD_GAMMA21-1477 [hydrothermal vent metagenome]|uniref:Uncharacterized protein n=1 Tax=hydrothermal vent metagenome TaxID=652676 RepID=A0A3B1A1T6_9ZZZZ
MSSHQEQDDNFLMLTLLPGFQSRLKGRLIEFSIVSTIMA